MDYKEVIEKYQAQLNAYIDSLEKLDTQDKKLKDFVADYLVSLKDAISFLSSDYPDEYEFDGKIKIVLAPWLLLKYLKANNMLANNFTEKGIDLYPIRTNIIASQKCMETVDSFMEDPYFLDQALQGSEALYEAFLNDENVINALKAL